MSFPSLHADVQSTYDPAPSLAKPTTAKIGVSASVPKGAGAVGFPVGTDGAIPGEVGLDRAALTAAGFDGKVGQTLVIPRPSSPTFVVFGVGPRAELDAARLRDAAAAFARAACRHPHLAIPMVQADGVKPDAAAQALVEGALLARYRFNSLRRQPDQEPALAELTLVVPGGPKDVQPGIERAGVTTRAVYLARDLANAPATLLTARRMADIAQALAPACGLEVEVFDGDALAKMGCGGMLGVNAGSAEPPRLVKLTYRPKDAQGKAVEPVGNVVLVGKGIMFDSGGISLKPNDLIHATMKTDMSGAAAVLASMTTLKALGCGSTVTGYLMCTDNMPSGAALKLGDVLTIRGGKTVEVQNIDAEGRLVLADGLMLATEQNPRPDAIVDIATLTGACQRALGNSSAGVIGNQQDLVDQVDAAAERTNETVWQLPLDARYRKELDSEIADLKNVGGENAGAITAALFLQEFVADIPWAHLDIAGTARVENDESWRSKGATAFGTRLLIDFLMTFRPPVEEARPQAVH
ncbi:MAG: leucyl aminopeptidase [Myxococcota bacterium]